MWVFIEKKKKYFLVKYDKIKECVYMSSHHPSLCLKMIASFSISTYEYYFILVIETHHTI